MVIVHPHSPTHAEGVTCPVILPSCPRNRRRHALALALFLARRGRATLAVSCCGGLPALSSVVVYITFVFIRIPGRAPTLPWKSSSTRPSASAVTPCVTRINHYRLHPPSQHSLPPVGLSDAIHDTASPPSCSGIHYSILDLNLCIACIDTIQVKHGSCFFFFFGSF